MFPPILLSHSTDDTAETQGGRVWIKEELEQGNRRGYSACSVWRVRVQLVQVEMGNRPPMTKDIPAFLGSQESKPWGSEPRQFSVNTKSVILHVLIAVFLHYLLSPSKLRVLFPPRSKTALSITFVIKLDKLLIAKKNGLVITRELFWFLFKYYYLCKFFGGQYDSTC